MAVCASSSKFDFDNDSIPTKNVLQKKNLERK